MVNKHLPVASSSGPSTLSMDTKRWLFEKKKMFSRQVLVMEYLGYGKKSLKTS